MNKKDIANIRKEFKLNNYRMNILEIFNVYVKKESGEIYHYVGEPFQMLDQETQELFLANFKKVLTGNLDSKLFELKFVHDVEDSTQRILFNGLHVASSDWREHMLQIVEKMFAHTVYEFDTVVTFIRGEYRQATKKRDMESEEGGDDEVSSSHFILCSLNKTDQPKKTLIFDYIDKEFKPNHAVDPIINLASPLSGFLFPTFQNHTADVNHILYCAGKANQPDVTFIEEVLNCGDIITAAEDKDSFELILNSVMGEEVDSRVISNVYEEIDKLVQENNEDKESELESPKLDYRDVERILTVSGVEDVDTAKVSMPLKRSLQMKRMNSRPVVSFLKKSKLKRKLRRFPSIQKN